MSGKNYTHFYNRYVCGECCLIFMVYGAMEQRKHKNPFCPNCGEHWDVRKEKSDRKSKPGRGVAIPWTPEEDLLIDRCIAGELAPNQVAMMTGRTLSSVYKKKTKREKKQKEQENHECII